MCALLMQLVLTLKEVTSVCVRGVPKAILTVENVRTPKY